ncbi:hypothetical protein ACLBV4_32775, partial [Pseudomonas aeruginosa]|uniref:hypothetical protein n=1 Tax=Pseudomonas aeruginosa TaxID=287 RepID=UPI0039699581
SASTRLLVWSFALANVAAVSYFLSMRTTMHPTSAQGQSVCGVDVYLALVIAPIPNSQALGAPVRRSTQTFVSFRRFQCH